MQREPQNLATIDLRLDGGLNADEDIVARLREAGLLRTSALQKSRGQNFLRDTNCARRIARCCDVGGGLSASMIVEIGAGAGALTRALFLEGARRVVAIESDVRLADFLRRASEGFGEEKTLQVIEADARTLDYADLIERGLTEEDTIIVGNLPYSVGTVILRKILEDGVRYRTMVLMFQREVAERIAADVGSSAYGRLSVMVGLRCCVERCFDVEPSVFVPVPRVVSCVLRFSTRGVDEELGDIVTDAEYGVVGEMTGLLFSYRRKRMSTILRMAGRGDWGRIGEGIGIDCSRRAGEVGIGEWLRWARAVMTSR